MPDDILMRAARGAAALDASHDESDCRYTLLTPDELMAQGAIQWRIKGIFPAIGVAALSGQPGSGKTFLALDAAAAMATGSPWFDTRTKAASVVYLGLEGEGGLAQRMQAFSLHNDTPENLRFITRAWDVRAPVDRRELVDAIKATGMAGGVLIVDTLSRAAPGFDENAPGDMGAVIAAMGEVQRELGGLVLLVHHTGKDQSRGLRGHSSLHGALDAVVEVSRREGSDLRQWKLTKAKDGQDGLTFAFDLETVPLGADEDGDPVTSCVVVPVDKPATTYKPLSPSETLGVTSFQKAVERDALRADDGSLIGVHLDDWRTHFYEASTADSQSAKQKSFQRVRAALVTRGELTVSDDVYSPVGALALACNLIPNHAGQPDMSGTNEEMSCPDRPQNRQDGQDTPPKGVSGVLQGVTRGKSKPKPPTTPKELHP